MRKILCLTGILSLLLSALSLSGCMPASEASPSGTTTQQLPESSSTTPSTVLPTEPSTAPSATLPTQTPVTESTSDSDDYIGTLFTREQLAAFNNEMRSFGSGRLYNAKRPPIPLEAQTEFGYLNAAFIGEDVPTVYLTFDCGYEHQNLTTKILDVLKEKNVKAVFFVTMYYCKTQPQLVRRMIEEGHTVGNHSTNHPNLPELTVEQVVYEIMSLHEYVKTNFDYEMTLLRPPSGCYSPRTLAIAQSLGYRSVFWSFAYKDWETDAQPSKDDAFHTVSSCAHNGCIYLLHAVSATNAAILEDVIDDLRHRGYTLELFQ